MRYISSHEPAKGVESEAPLINQPSEQLSVKYTSCVQDHAEQTGIYKVLSLPSEPPPNCGVCRESWYFGQSVP